MKKLFCLSLASVIISSAANAAPSELLGAWRIDRDVPPIWKARVVVKENRISLGSPECRNLRYTVIRHESLGAKGEAFVLDIATPPDRCRPAAQEKVIWHFLIQHNGPVTYMHLDMCPSFKDLDQFMRGSMDHSCSGSFYGEKETKKAADIPRLTKPPHFP